MYFKSFFVLLKGGFMKDKAFAIFIYDLCVLGRGDIVINEALLGILHQYILEDMDNRFEVSTLMFDVEEEDNNYVFRLSLERITKACELVRNVSAQKSGYSVMFDGLDSKETQSLGDFAVVFSSYLDELEDRMYEEQNNPYKLMKS